MMKSRRLSTLVLWSGGIMVFLFRSSTSSSNPSYLFCVWWVIFSVWCAWHQRLFSPYAWRRDACCVLSLIHSKDRLELYAEDSSKFDETLDQQFRSGYPPKFEAEPDLSLSQFLPHYMGQNLTKISRKSKQYFWEFDSRGVSEFCRSHQALSNGVSFAQVGVDTAGNGPSYTLGTKHRNII